MESYKHPPGLQLREIEWQMAADTLTAAVAPKFKYMDLTPWQDPTSPTGYMSVAFQLDGRYSTHLKHPQDPEVSTEVYDTAEQAALAVALRWLAICPSLDVDQLRPCATSLKRALEEPEAPGGAFRRPQRRKYVACQSTTAGLGPRESIL